ncbi:MAG: c-type cytochrome [Campylobacterales bacterium]|nr:c-type cytochrome [Campylobacterales bacterium]
MNKTVKLLTLTALTGISLAAADFITATKADKLDASKVKLESVTLYPQTTIGNNDKEATEKMKGLKALPAQAGAVFNDKEVLVVIKYKDATNSKQSQKSSKLFGDGVAVQFPSACNEADKLPYIGMGSEGRQVTVLLQKNTEGVYPVSEKADVTTQQVRQNLNLFGEDLKKKEAAQKALAGKYAKVFVSEGFRSMTEAKDAKGYEMSMTYKSGEWTAVFKKPLNDEYSKACDVLPMAIAVWDGAKDGRNGNKWLSGWTPIKMKDTAKAKADIATITAKSKGNVANGKKLATDNCAACHTMGDIKAPMAYMAPDLSNIGGYATAGYLKESIVTPSAVVVPGYNKNAHPSGVWYSADDKGARTSTMPGFDFLKPSEIDDLIAFLQTLKAGVK